MSTTLELNTTPQRTPTYPSDRTKPEPLTAKNYTVLFCNPKPRFLRLTCAASLAYALLVAFAAYQLAMSSIEGHNRKRVERAVNRDGPRSDDDGDDDGKDDQSRGGEPSFIPFDTKMKMALSLFAVSLAVGIGFAYFSRKNILEMGLVRNDRGQVTDVRLVFGDMFARRGTVERFYATKAVSTSSLHMLKLNPVETIKQSSEIRRRKRFGDYMFVNVEHSKQNYLMDITSQGSFVNKAEMARFFGAASSSTDASSSKNVRF